MTYLVMFHWLTLGEVLNLNLKSKFMKLVTEIEVYLNNDTHEILLAHFTIFKLMLS